MAWILANITTIVSILGAVVGLASAVTAITKTPKDDSVISVIKSIVDRLSILTAKDAANTVKLPGTKSQPLMVERNIKEPTDLFKK